MGVKSENLRSCHIRPYQAISVLTRPLEYKEWNRHVWKHWQTWKDEHAWLEISQTGLGCVVCSGAGVKKSSWSKFRACRSVAR